MATWGETLTQLQDDLTTTGSIDFDGLRRGRLDALAAKTGRSLISYAADVFSPHPDVGVNLQDMLGMMEVFKDLPGPNLDLLLYTPGGSAEATDRLVTYLRTKFTHIRVFVPFVAMSAGTMWAMAADEIVMGKHSQLGPIDPQIRIAPNGVSMPAGALLDQFREAQSECVSDPARITGWLPILQQYPPGLLNFCESSQDLSKTMVTQWLERYMFAGETDASDKAAAIADWLADDKLHLSHSRAITRDELRGRGVVVKDLEEDEELQNLVLGCHHAIIHSFSTTAFKMIENNLGKRFVQQGGAMVPQLPIPPMQMPVMPNP